MDRKFSLWIIVLNVVILGVTLFNTMSMAGLSVKFDVIEKSVARIDKSVVNPAYAGENAKNIPEDSSVYMQQVTQEYLLYEICYGDPMYAFTNPQPFTSNQKCPTLNKN